MTPSRSLILRDSPTCGGGCALLNQLLSPIRTAMTVAVALAALGVPPGRELELDGDSEVAAAGVDHLACPPVLRDRQPTVMPSPMSRESGQPRLVALTATHNEDRERASENQPGGAGDLPID